ncbi:ribonuclease H-like domain-containing protein [Tanacetum coccineum]
MYMPYRIPPFPSRIESRLGSQPFGIKKPIKTQKKRLGNFLEIHKRLGNFIGNVSNIRETAWKRFGGVSVPTPFPNGNVSLEGVSVLHRRHQISDASGYRIKCGAKRFLVPLRFGCLFRYRLGWTAGCPTTRRSTSGYCVFLGKNLLSWSSKRQPTLSRSSAEAEYRGVANVVAETCWLRNLLRELHTPLSSATLVYCDNVSAVYLSCNPVQHQRTKHIEIDIHYVRDLVAAGQVRVLHVPSHYQYADIFNK